MGTCSHLSSLQNSHLLVVGGDLRLLLSCGKCPQEASWLLFRPLARILCSYAGDTDNQSRRDIKGSGVCRQAGRGSPFSLRCQEVSEEGADHESEFANPSD